MIFLSLYIAIGLLIFFALLRVCFQRDKSPWSRGEIVMGGLVGAVVVIGWPFVAWCLLTQSPLHPEDCK